MHDAPGRHARAAWSHRSGVLRTSVPVCAANPHKGRLGTIVRAGRGLPDSDRGPGRSSLSEPAPRRFVAAGAASAVDETEVRIPAPVSD